MVGYPGAGKTTISKYIHELTGAVHLWVDGERQQRFSQPTYSQAENTSLYDDLNALTVELLSTGKSVIFDTNFNFYKDREYLRSLASQNSAECVIIWVTTPLGVAEQRAVKGKSHTNDTRPFGKIAEKDFKRIVGNFEVPRADEVVHKITGIDLSIDHIRKFLIRCGVNLNQTKN